jgi:hypothetical protein
LTAIKVVVRSVIVLVSTSVIFRPSAETVILAVFGISRV